VRGGSRTSAVLLCRRRADEACSCAAPQGQRRVRMAAALRGSRGVQSRLGGQAETQVVKRGATAGFDPYRALRQALRTAPTRGRDSRYILLAPAEGGTRFNGSAGGARGPESQGAFMIYREKRGQRYIPIKIKACRWPAATSRHHGYTKTRGRALRKAAGPLCWAGVRLLLRVGRRYESLRRTPAARLAVVDSHRMSRHPGAAVHVFIRGRDRRDRAGVLLPSAQLGGRA